MHIYVDWLNMETCIIQNPCLPAHKFPSLGTTCDELIGMTSVFPTFGKKMNVRGGDVVTVAIIYILASNLGM